MRIDGLRPLRVGEILDVALKIYRERFGTLVRAVAVVVIPVAVVIALVQISIPADPFVTPTGDPFAPFGPGADPSAPGGAALPDIDEEAFAGWLGGSLVVALLSWLATMLATAACFAVVRGAYLDRVTTWRDSVGFARARLRPLVWLYIVEGVLFALILFAFLVPPILLFGSVALMAIAFLALLATMVYLFVAWAVAVPVLLFEDVRGGKALRRSRQLLKGRWWPTLAVLVLVAILTIIVQLAIGGALAGVFAAGGGEVVDVVANGVAGTIANMFTIPFAAAATTVLYFDALVRKEGFDLARLAQGVESPPSADDRGWPPAGPASGSPPAGEAPPSWPPSPDWRPSG